jgi:hypothetical protein
VQSFDEEAGSSLNTFVEGFDCAVTGTDVRLRPTCTFVADGNDDGNFNDPTCISDNWAAQVCTLNAARDGCDGELFAGTCDVDIDECLSAPCQNGGVCAESLTNVFLAPDVYTCTCPPADAGRTVRWHRLKLFEPSCACPWAWTQPTRARSRTRRPPASTAKSTSTSAPPTPARTAPSATSPGASAV